MFIVSSIITFYLCASRGISKKTFQDSVYYSIISVGLLNLYIFFNGFDATVFGYYIGNTIGMVIAGVTLGGITGFIISKILPKNQVNKENKK